MTELSCDQYVCDKSALLNKLLRASDTDIVNGTKSVLSLFNQGQKAKGRKWLNTNQYSVGDIVTLNSFVYIALSGNTNKDPSVEKTIWKSLVLQNAQNMGKIKAYAVIMTDLTILKSYNISSLTQLTNTGIQFNFTTAIGTAAIACVGFPEAPLAYTYVTDTLQPTTTYIRCTAKYIDSVQKSINDFTDTNNIYMTLIVYSNGATIA
jgi:hypothetical protein